MYTGQVAQISNKATWRKSARLINKRDQTVADLTNPDLNLDIVVTIRGMNGSDYGSNNIMPLVIGSLDNGKVTVPGPGFQWQFEDSDLRNLCAGTYRLGVKVTINDFVVDLIAGTIAVVEGN